MSDIVERLKAAAKRNYESQPEWWRRDNRIEQTLESKAASELSRLKAENERLRGDLTWIADQRFQERLTVNPDNAFEHFSVLNKQICQIFGRAARALKTED